MQPQEATLMCWSGQESTDVPGTLRPDKWHQWPATLMYWNMPGKMAVLNKYAVSPLWKTYNNKITYLWSSSYNKTMHHMFLRGSEGSVNLPALPNSLHHPQQKKVQLYWSASLSLSFLHLVDVAVLLFIPLCCDLHSLFDGGLWIVTQHFPRLGQIGKGAGYISRLNRHRIDDCFLPHHLLHHRNELIQSHRLRIAQIEHFKFLTRPIQSCHYPLIKKYSIFLWVCCACCVVGGCVAYLYNISDESEVTWKRPITKSVDRLATNTLKKISLDN